MRPARSRVVQAPAAQTAFTTIPPSSIAIPPSLLHLSLHPYLPFRKGLSKPRRPRETPPSPIAPMRSLPQPRYWLNAAFKIFYTFIFWDILVRRIQRVRRSRMHPSNYFSFSFFEFFLKTYSKGSKIVENSKIVLFRVFSVESTKFSVFSPKFNIFFNFLQ